MARSRLRPGAGNGGCHVWRLLCLGQLLLFLTLDSMTNMCVFLQGWSSAAMLLPLTMLAFGTLTANGIEGLDAMYYPICAQSVLILLFAQATLPLPQNAYPESSTLPLLIGLLPALASLLVAWCWRGRWSVIASFALLAASGLASRAGFREDKSCPLFAGSHTSPRFQETQGPAKLLPYVQRIHQYDNHRMDAFLAIVDSVRYVKSFDTRNDAVYWFDMLDPHAIIYDNLACTRCWGYSVLNFNFPNAWEARKFDRTEIQAGQLIAIPSVHPDAYGFAKLGLAGIGFGARLVDRREIAHGPIHFAITLIELEPLQKKGHTPTR
jgi:hypothetical protein